MHRCAENSWCARLEHCGVFDCTDVPTGSWSLPAGLRLDPRLAFHLSARGRIHEVDGTLGGDAQPVHQPDVVLAHRDVAPQDVGLAVAIEVADPLHLPRLVAQRVDRTRPGDRETVHQVDVVLAGRGVAPQEVGLAVAVEVADPLHLPARGRIHKVDGTLGSGAQPVHQPDVVLAGRGVPPQDVGLAVAVEITDAGDGPVRVLHRAQKALRPDRGPIHEVAVVLPGSRVAPQDVRAAVTAEIGAQGMKNDLANSVVSLVRDVQIAARIQRDPVWVVETRARRRTAIAREGGAAIARHGGDDPRRRGDPANSVVALVRDVDIAVRIQRDTIRVVEARARRRTTVAREGGAAIARHGGDDSRRRIDLANAVVVLVRNIEVATCIQRHSSWVVEARARRRAAIAQGAATTGYGRDDPRRGGDFANSAVVRVRDIEIPARIQRDTGRVVETRVRRHTAIAREGVEAIARHGRDDPRRRSDLANAVVALVRDVEIAARIQRDTDWAVEARTRRRTAIAREAKGAVARHRRDDS